ncbi:MAG: hypothetical protein H3Z54_09495 [archaeon]|nr:hypothetical protein [archaeon]
MVEKTINIVKEGKMITADTGIPEWLELYKFEVELPPYTKINWAKLHIKAECYVAITIFYIPVGGKLMVYLNDNLVADHQQVPQHAKIDEYKDVTPYIMPKEGGAEGAKKINYMLLKVRTHIIGMVTFRFPIDLIYDYSGEAPTTTTEFVSESKVESYEGKLLQMITKPEGVILIVTFLAILFIIISFVVRRR